MIQIIDNKEPLVDLSSVCEKIKINLEPARLKIEKSVFLRKTPALMLSSAEELLPDDIYFCINDAYRPLSVQQKCFNQYMNKFRKLYPEYDESKLRKLTAKFVIDPNDIQRAGHLTGGAIDIVLAKNDKRLPMKNLSLSFEKRSMTSIDKKMIILIIIECY